MSNINSIVKIHPTSNVTKKDEFQIKKDPILKLPKFQMGKFIIKEHVDVSLMMNSNGLYEHNFTVYSRSLSLKYQSLVTYIYDHLDVEELKQLRLTVEEKKITDFEFFKTCSKCGKACYQEKNIVQCFCCDFWIHNNVNCCIYGKCCPSCYQTRR